MLAQTRILIIDAGGKTYTFRVRIHKAESPAEQLIEAAFYQEFAKAIHEGVHYEMELVESPVWGRLNPEVPIHIHENPDSKRKFVCFTGNIQTLDEALSVLRTWCVGTVYTLTQNQDFGLVVRNAGDDFIGFMRDRFGVVLSGDMEAKSENQHTVHFEVYFPTFWGCLPCQKKIKEGVASIKVFIDGKQYMLGANEDGTCPHCNGVKTGKTPALFDTPELANAHAQMLVEKFQAGDESAYQIKVLDFGVLTKGSAAVN